MMSDKAKKDIPRHLTIKFPDESTEMYKVGTRNALQLAEMLKPVIEEDINASWTDYVYGYVNGLLSTLYNEKGH